MPAFEVDESVEINAPLDAVKSSILDFRAWSAWSPWVCADPDCKLDYAQDKQSYSWDGQIIGAGGMKVKEVKDDAIYYDLEFLKPFKSKSKVDFQLHAVGDTRTRLHWRMQSSLPFFMFFMVKSMRAFISGDYRRGLLKLKDLLEQGKVPSELEFPGVGQGLETAYFGIRKVSTLGEIAKVTAQEMPRLYRELEQRGEAITGPAMTISHSFDPVEDRLAYTLALAVKAPLGDLGSDFVSDRIAMPRSYQVVHKGPYRHLANAWASGMMHERAKKFRPIKKADKIEVYLNDPETTPEQELLTRLHFPAR